MQLPYKTLESDSLLFLSWFLLLGGSVSREVCVLLSWKVFWSYFFVFSFSVCFLFHSSWNFCYLDIRLSWVIFSIFLLLLLCFLGDLPDFIFNSSVGFFLLISHLPRVLSSFLEYFCNTFWSFLMGSVLAGCVCVHAHVLMCSGICVRVCVCV